ncbi:MAG: amidohydrolase [Parabacteroides sp.]|nr:amidohydrolase [Parabacteroides sp.]
MSILIKNVLFNDRTIDVYIEGKEIKRIGEGLSLPADKILDGSRKAIIPGFVNAHTHAAMTLFRGFGDDMPLMPWLEQKIWPNEAKMTREDVYWGAKLACLEMIKSGTTTFFDMYHKFRGTADATEEMGLRGIISGVCFDHFQPDQAEKCKRHNEKLIEEVNGYSKRIQYALGPHAIYTVSGELLRWCHQFAMKHNAPIHLHLAETEVEVENSIKHFGLSPVRYLYKLGILSPHLIIAHGIYIDDDELRMLADHEVKVVHNPASNMKLASGMHFKFKEMRQLGITVGLGTDGCSSSNNLDMIESMKLASLLGKAWRKDPEALTANEMLQAATAEGAAMFGLKAGQIKEGYLADLCLIDLNTPAFTPNFNFVSNLVYAANGSCVDTVICDGKILMENKKVPGEDEIMEKAAETAYNLMKR